MLAVGFSGGAPNLTSPGRTFSVSRADFCITEGALEQVRSSRLVVTVPKMRAVVAASTAQLAEARLTYLGPTSAEARLGSGEMRRQFGLKQRAQDACNLVYAMWRTEPESGVIVSIKSNPGKHTSSECGNRGYRNIRPRRLSPVPILSPGDSHSFLAQMNGTEMRVSVDSIVVWEGDLGPEPLSFNGPVGVRTDNGRFEFEFFTQKIGGTIPCRTGDAGSE